MRAAWLCLSALGVFFFHTGTASAQDPAVEDPLADLAALGASMTDAAPEGGGSIRAKKEVDSEVAKRQADPRNLEAKVEEVKLGAFPRVAIKVKVTKSAKEGKGKDIAKNATLVLMPVFKVVDGKISMEDADTRLNAGAFYLITGDKVLIRLGDNPKGQLWKAEYIERK